MPLDPRIKKAGDLAKEAFKQLKKIQVGEKPIIKTGQDFIDVHLNGLLPSDVIVYAAGSGVGKTKLLYDTLDSMLSVEVNKNAENFVTLQFELEMRFLNKILRDTHQLTGSKKSDILSKEFTEDQKEIVARYYKNLQDNRRFICEESVTTEEFFTMTDDFCAENSNKDAIIVTLDHCLLLKKSYPNEDTSEILTSKINILRKKYHNVYFILLSQFNRGALANIADKSNSMLPTTALIYGSSHFEFLSSFIVALLDPFKLGVNEYLKVNPDRYDWLEEYMTDEDKKGKVSFNTLGNQFIHTLKTRESDAPYMNLHIRKMSYSTEQLDKMRQSVETREPTVIVSDIPVFGAPKLIPMQEALEKPGLDLNNFNGTFGNSFVDDDKDDPPF